MRCKYSAVVESGEWTICYGGKMPDTAFAQSRKKEYYCNESLRFAGRFNAIEKR